MSETVPDNTKAIAYHEAAHVVVPLRVMGSADATYISIVPREDSLGQVGEIGTFIDHGNPDHIRANVISLYAGAVAARRVDSAAEDHGGSDDDESARAQLRAVGWEPLEPELRREAERQVDELWPEIAAVGDELLRVQVLNDDEVEHIADAVREGRDPGADLAEYRQCCWWVDAWRAAFIQSGGNVAAARRRA
jgi:hypothetical protein